MTVADIGQKKINKAIKSYRSTVPFSPYSKDGMSDENRLQ
jgi:hypothetical protein